MVIPSASTSSAVFDPHSRYMGPVHSIEGLFQCCLEDCEVQSRFRPGCLASESSVTSSISLPFPSADNTTSVAKPIPLYFVYNSCFHPGIKHELPQNSKKQKPKEQAQGQGNHNPDPKGHRHSRLWGSRAEGGQPFPWELVRNTDRQASLAGLSHQNLHYDVSLQGTSVWPEFGKQWAGPL